MAKNSFHKYVSAIRKSKSFKPVVLDQTLGGHYKVVAKCWDTRYIFGPMLIEEVQDIIGKYQTVITSDLKTNEMYAYDMFL